MSESKISLADAKTLAFEIRQRIKERRPIEENDIGSKIRLCKTDPEISPTFLTTLAHGEFVTNFYNYVMKYDHISRLCTRTCLYMFAYLSHFLSTAKLFIEKLGWKSISKMLQIFRARIIEFGLENYPMLLYLFEILNALCLPVFTSSSPTVFVQWESDFQFTTITMQLFCDLLQYEKEYDSKCIKGPCSHITAFIHIVPPIYEILGFFLSISDISFYTYQQQFFSTYLQVFLEVTILLSKYLQNSLDGDEQKKVDICQKEADHAVNFVSSNMPEFLFPPPKSFDKGTQTYEFWQLIPFYILCYHYPNKLKKFAKKELVGDAVVEFLCCHLRLEICIAIQKNQPLLCPFFQFHYPSNTMFKFLRYSHLPRAQKFLQLLQYSCCITEEGFACSKFFNNLAEYRTYIQKHEILSLGRASSYNTCSNPSCPNRATATSCPQNNGYLVACFQNANKALDDLKLTAMKTVAFSVCSGCRLSRYCSKSCQKIDWRDHKVICKEHARYWQLEQ